MIPDPSLIPPEPHICSGNMCYRCPKDPLEGGFCPEKGGEEDETRTD
jgi:hypothetical protein